MTYVCAWFIDLFDGDVNHRLAHDEDVVTSRLESTLPQNELSSEPEPTVARDVVN